MFSVNAAYILITVFIALTAFIFLWGAALNFFFFIVTIRFCSVLTAFTKQQDHGSAITRYVLLMQKNIFHWRARTQVAEWSPVVAKWLPVGRQSGCQWCQVVAKWLPWCCPGEPISCQHTSRSLLQAICWDALLYRYNREELPPVAVKAVADGASFVPSAIRWSEESSHDVWWSIFAQYGASHPLDYAPRIQMMWCVGGVWESWPW